MSWLPPSDEGRLPQVSTPGRRPVTNGVSILFFAYAPLFPAESRTHVLSAS